MIGAGLQGLLFAGVNYTLNKFTTNNYIDIFYFEAKNFELNGSIETTDLKNNQGDSYKNFIKNSGRSISVGGVTIKNLVTSKKNRGNYDYGLSALFIEGLKNRQKIAPLFLKTMQFTGFALLKDYSISNYGEQNINLNFEEVFLFFDNLNTKINGVVATPTPQLVKVVGF